MKTYKFTIRGNEYEVELKQFEENLARIEVNGTLYEVEVHREMKTSKTPTLVRSEVPPPSRSDSKIKKTISSGPSAVKAPLPGNVMQIYVKPGDAVKRGDKLLMYEAMKMENLVLAEKDGKIVAVKVHVGDAVLQGDLLIEMD
ncbi:MAG TPA: biotin/lipoyl-binding protein [Bacteroidales bacterium]|nr:biotin/lipoyl-binding protein [Bacteroidales bacterium]